MHPPSDTPPPCAGKHNLFLAPEPHHNAGADHPDRVAYANTVAEARAICATCDRHDECRDQHTAEMATGHASDDFGIWYGTTPAQRRQDPTCAHCDKPLTSRQVSSRGTYCSPKCAYEYRNANSVAGTTIICRGCGIPYTAPRKRSVYHNLDCRLHNRKPAAQV